MNHLLNICNINGAEVEPVDVIIGGSPCQDLSVAGKRAGLDGERSGLFMEQIRIIKEMRYATNGINPRYMVWENVPGAFSSNKAEDFRIVLEETARIADSSAVIPRPPKNKWATAGCIMGDGWSIAWRVLDAQFWGVPQRRRRIALVADFGGQSAPEILFEREGVRGDIAESGAAGEGVAGDVEGGVGAASAECWAISGKQQSLVTSKDVANTLGSNDYKEPQSVCTTQPIGFSYKASAGEGAPSEPVTYPGVGITSKQNASKGTPGVCHTLNQDSRNYVVARGVESGAEKAIGFDGYNAQVTGDKSATLGVNCGMTTGRNGVIAGFCQGASPAAKTIGYQEEVSPTIKGAPSGTAQVPAVYDARGNGDGAIAPTMTGDHQNRVTDYTRIVAAVDCRNGTENPDINGTLQAKPNGGTSYNLQNTVRTHQSVRRLTPLECERLQGFPDNWTNIPPQAEVTAEELSFWRTVWDEWQAMNDKKLKTDKQIIKWLKSEPADTARYKALGNSIALPPWRFVLGRIYQHGARTLGSLFDGIGGFPKIWQELGGQTLWCSEIEPFPIAVTRYHFKEAQNGK